jgi:hypothetical protein
MAVIDSFKWHPETSAPGTVIQVRDPNTPVSHPIVIRPGNVSSFVE